MKTKANEAEKTAAAKARIRAAKANARSRDLEQRDREVIHTRVMSRLQAEGIASTHPKFQPTYRTYSFQEVNAMAARRKHRRDEQAKRVADAEEAKTAAAARKKRAAELVAKAAKATPSPKKAAPVAHAKKAPSKLSSSNAVAQWIAAGRTKKDRDGRAAYAKNWPDTALSMARRLENERLRSR